MHRLLMPWLHVKLTARRRLRKVQRMCCNVVPAEMLVTCYEHCPKALAAKMQFLGLT